MTARSATRVGQGYGEKRVQVDPVPAAPAVETPSRDAVGVGIQPVPEPPAEISNPDWRDEPWIEGQHAKHPKSVRVSGLKARIFRLDDEVQLREYNEILAKTRLQDPGIIISQSLVQPSTKTDGFVVFLQYRVVEYRRITPQADKAGNN
jgi:hypothetical protein